MNRPINFEYQEIDLKGHKFTVVALDSKLKDYDFQPVIENGMIKMRNCDKTVKDCRNIDGCVYFHKGFVSDSVMVDLIEKFQKLKKEKGWIPGKGIWIPDPNLKLN